METVETTATDLLSLGLLPPLPTAFLEGRDLDLLDPLRFLPPGELPPPGRSSSAPPTGGETAAADRAGLAEALAAANESYGHPAAGALAAKLADPATRVVIAGQQPGLAGGPLYTLSKALAVVRWVEELERRGESAVAVFWVATEDHDFAEVSRLAVPGRRGLTRLDLGPDPAPLTPVGLRALGEGVGAVFDGWRQTTSSAGSVDWLDRVAGWCAPEESFGEAFCRVMVGMMGELCPLLADAMLPAIKRAQSPQLTRLIDDREGVETAFATADETIAAKGYSPQVRPQRGVSPLFLVRDGERRRIEWRGEARYGLRGLEGFEASVDDLRQIAQDDPSQLSPGVLARPALQDAVFGTHLQVLGPGEVSYFPQAAPLYRELEIEAPWISARPQMLVLPARQAARLDELGIDLARLIAGEVDADVVVAERAGEDLVAPVLGRVEAELATLREPVLELDRSLERPLEKTVSQVRRGLELFGAKVAAASARRHEVERNRVAGLIETVRPGGGAQERVIAGAHFVGRHQGFVEAARRQLGLDPRRLHLIDPEVR